MYSILSITAVTFAVLVVSSSNTIYSLMYLIALFLTVAGLLISQGVTYIGLLYIVVYVGAIAILFLFVVMMINVRDAELNTIGNKYTQSLPLTFVLGTLFYYLVTEYAGNLTTITVPLSNTITGWQNANNITDTNITSFTIVEALGQSLYTWGGLWLLVAALILLLCIVGPIVLTLQDKDNA